MQELYANFRKHWPAPAKPAAVKTLAEPLQDGQDVANQDPSPAEVGADDSTALDAGDDFETLDDVALAMALGVPNECVERMTPQKTNPHHDDTKGAATGECLEGSNVIPTKGKPEVPTKELSDAEKRDLRIQQLMLLDNKLSVVFNSFALNCSMLTTRICYVYY